MVNLIFKTKGMVNPKGKPRVYFTCHPDDFEKSFDKICEDIFKTHDCAIYYTEDMNEAFDEQNLDTDLGQMNLFVIPVTLKLLTTLNRTMSFDFVFAKEKHIPVLPIMLESGIDKVFSRSDKFGEFQYLNPYSSDLTEISYEEKLKKYLVSVLIGDEMARKVRAAFDAYIFLSYRKKDRQYANKLMRMIHSKPKCRDIAVWYDEYLTPGESFNENIGRMMKASKVFTLLVTPNLLEEPDGKPNFVMAHEYPEARNMGMDILPAEMVKTDKDILGEKYEGIPTCVDPYEEEAFSKRLLETIEKIAVSDTHDDPEHNFLIGLAYLDGIDVETDRDRGIELIIKAAEQNLIEACEKLVKIYNDSNSVKDNINEAIAWQKKCCDLYYKKYIENKDNSGCIDYLNSELSLAKYQLDGDFLKDARNTCWRIIKLCRNNGGYGSFINDKRIPIYIETYSVLGDVFHNREDIGQTRECYEKAVDVYNRFIGTIERTPKISHIIATCYYKLSKVFEKAPFENDKIRHQHLEKAMLLLIDSQERNCNSNNNYYLGRCYMELGELYKKDSLEKAIKAFDKANELFAYELQYDENSNVYSSICELYIQFGDVYNYFCFYDNAVDYYEKAMNICTAFLNNTDELEMNYNFCQVCLKMVELTNKSSLKSRHVDIEKSVISVAMWLVEKVPSEKYQELLADAYMICRKCDSEYGAKAFELYRELDEKSPNVYYKKFWKIRKALWEEGLLSENCFPFVRLQANYDDKGTLLYYSDAKGQTFHFNVRFEGVTCKSEDILEIKICRYALGDIESKYCHNYKVDGGYNIIQLSQADALGTRSNPAPEEFVFVTFKTNSNTKRWFAKSACIEVRFQRCYG